MRVMFLAEVYKYTDCEGRFGEFAPYGNFVETIEEAKENVKDVKRNFPIEGSWRIIKKTIDEATFTVKVETIEEYNYFKEVEQYKLAEELLEMYTKRLEEEKAHLQRCKTERTIKAAEKEIEYIKKEIEYNKKILAEKK